jgi:hypothetical protein
MTAALLTTGCFGTGKAGPAHVTEHTFKPDTSGNVVYLQPAPGRTQPVISRGYQVGEQRVAAVGEPMFIVRNYTAAERVVSAIARHSFRQLCKKPKAGEPATDELACNSGRLSFIRGSEHDRFDVAGAIADGGSTYYMVKVPTTDGAIYLAVDANGRLRPGRYAAWSPSDPENTPAGVALRWQDTPVGLDDTSLFQLETTETPIASSNFVHYAIVYRGVTLDYRGLVFHLLYREYGQADENTPVYEQSLDYAGGVSVIDVLGLRLRVHDFNESQIVYTVLSD